MIIMAWKQALAALLASFPLAAALVVTPVPPRPPAGAAAATTAATAAAPRQRTSSWLDGPKVGSMGVTHCFRGKNHFQNDLPLAAAQAACDSDDRCAFLWSHRCQGRWWKCYGAVPAGNFAPDATSCTQVRQDAADEEDGDEEGEAEDAEPRALGAVRLGREESAEAAERNRQAAAGKMDAQLSRLAAHLAKVAEHHSGSLASLRNSYEKRLNNMWKAIHSSEAMSARLRREIETLDVENGALRRYAHALRRNGEELESFLKELRANVSTAQEFAGKMMAAAGNLLQASPKVTVLTELRRRELERRASDLEQRFDEIEAFGRMALLQLPRRPAAHVSSAASAADADAQEAQRLVSTLSSAFAKLDGEHATSERALVESFEEELADVAKRNETVMNDQAQLNGTFTEKNLLHTRLQAAVKYLRDSHERLRESVSGLMKFIHDLADPPAAQ